MQKETAKKCIPFLLTAICMVLDQLTKYLVIRHIPPYPYGSVQVLGDVVRLIHVSNPGIAFSMGGTLPQTVRSLLFSVLPLVVLVLVIVVYFRNQEFTWLQRWCICGVVGGGFGNLYDRLFRTEGVIDFIDVKFWGILSMERWPTFNVADATIVVCGLLLMLSFLCTVQAARTAE